MATRHDPLRAPLDRAAFDALAEGVVWQSADGHLIAANRAALAILGLEEDEVLGRTSLDPRWYAVRQDGSAWPGDEHPAMVALRTGEPQHHQVMGFIAPGQGRRWISIHATPLREAASGDVTGVVCSFTDVTETVELRRRLERINKELADLYDHAPCGYHMLDATGRFVRVNDTELKWLGCTRDEVVGRLGPKDFTNDAGRAAFQASFPRIVAGHLLEGVEFDLIGRHGEVRHVRISASPILDEEGRFVATRSVVHDITELHASRTALQQLASEQAAILDNDLVGIVKLRGRQIEWKNRAFDRMFGYAAGDLIGQESSVLYPDLESFERLSSLAYPVLQAGGVFRVQIELRRKDGQSVWTDCSGFMLDRDAGLAIWFSRDITELRRAEELRVKAAQLEAENRQLAETSRLQRAFLSNVSHELRTPLNAVMGFAHLLKSAPPPSLTTQQASYLDYIESAGQQLLEMIERMLEVAAAEKGALSFHAQPVDLRATVDEVVALLAPKASARHLAVAADVAGGLDDVRLDPLRLRQILLNYIGNAIKFSHEGGRVQVRLLPEGASHLRIEVEDQGIGIAADDQRTLFASIHQLSSGATKAYEGAGFGLALVKLLVEAQGGRVEVHSTPGRGSVFVAVLPRVFPAA